MRLTETGAIAHALNIPSMLDVVRLSPRKIFPPGGVELYRQIAVLTEMRSGTEVLDVASGTGVPLQYFATEFGVNAAGIDIDPSIVGAADSASRELEAGDRLQFQSNPSDSLPYRDDIFDVTIGEIGLANHCDPEEAVSEMVRVTRPGGFVVLVQLVWKAPIGATRQMILSDHLGVRPIMLVEWKRILREAGVGGVRVEDWSGEQEVFRPRSIKPFADFWAIFTLAERFTILRRARRRWGLRGVWTTLLREREARRLLTSERVLGLNLICGRKVGTEPVYSGRTFKQIDEMVSSEGASLVPELPLDAPQPPVPEQEGLEQTARIKTEDVDSRSSGRTEDQTETSGLPLFGERPTRGKE